eukprot:m.228718 g.228718  ORF g.228718 m.228718 type:complete len:416 (+) comp11778_c0_seq1:46-1293(+)
MATKAKRHTQRGSRHSKKNMRTKIDITEIDSYLEDVRQDERTGGPMEIKTDEQLFFTDKVEEPAAPVVQRVSRKQRLAGKSLYCEDNIPSQSKTAPVRSNKKAVEKKVATGLRKEVTPAPEPTRAVKRPAPVDVWAPESEEEKEEPDEWVPQQPKLKPPPTAGNPLPAARPAPMLDTSASYNPTADAHAAALAAALEKERKRTERDRMYARRAPKHISAAERSRLILEELDVGAGEGIEVDEADGALPAGGKPTRAEDRKTKAQRSREKRQKEEQAAAAERKAKAVAEHDVFRLRSLRKEIVEDESRAEQRQAERAAKPAKRPRLGPHKDPDRAPNFLLTDELVGSLRQLTPQGNVAYDFMDNLFRKNIVEPRRPVALRRKYKLKTYTKRSFKNFDLQEQIKADRKAKAKAKSKA